MSTFREKIQPKEEAEIEARETPDLVTLKEEDTTETTQGEEEERLDVWEAEKNRKYCVEYFDVKETAHEFPIKADIGKIDKYIKEEMKRRNYENSVDNYRKILGDIEESIQTKSLERFERIKKVRGYIQVLEKYRKIKELKESYVY